jgi:8-oxo-dGTP diphosphatase
VTSIHLASGLVLRDGRVLLVASRYANHSEPLWNLPGGRQQHGELLRETVVREVLEETGLHATAGELAYVSESYDGDTHFLNAAFCASVGSSRSSNELQVRQGEDHVVAVEWVPIEELASRIVVGVVREPLLAYLRGELTQRYAGFHHAGITIEWPDRE